MLLAMIIEMINKMSENTVVEINNNIVIINLNNIEIESTQIIVV